MWFSQVRIGYMIPSKAQMEMVLREARLRVLRVSMSGKEYGVHSSVGSSGGEMKIRLSRPSRAYRYTLRHRHCEDVNKW